MQSDQAARKKWDEIVIEIIIEEVAKEAVGILGVKQEKTKEDDETLYFSWPQVDDW